MGQGTRADRGDAEAMSTITPQPDQAPKLSQIVTPIVIAIVLIIFAIKVVMTSVDETVRQNQMNAAKAAADYERSLLQLPPR